MQLTLSLVTSLTTRFKSLRDVTQTAVIKSKGGVSGIAPALDMSPSKLGRKLAGKKNDPHGTLDIEYFDQILTQLAKEGDLSPLLYLIEKYLPSDDQRRGAALDRFAALMPEIVSLMSEIKPKAPRR